MYTSEINTAKAVLQEINDPFLKGSGIKLYIKREDLIHPLITGNKWYKLKYNLEAADKSGFRTLFSFGGAYSNHIYALAAAGRIFNFRTIGIIRGEEHLPLNPTLSFAEESGMNLHYMPRSEYRKKKDPEILNQLKEQFGDFYLIPEGGTNAYAVNGCREIVESIKIPFDYICTPCGTGGTIAGLIAGANHKNKILGFPALKGGSFLFEDIKNLLAFTAPGYTAEWDLVLDYHFGGYARYNIDLLKFMEQFEEANNILLDQVYTAKMMFGIYDLIRRNYFPDGSVIVAVHTGGIQGRLKSLSVRVHPLP